MPSISIKIWSWSCLDIFYCGRAVLQVSLLWFAKVQNTNLYTYVLGFWWKGLSFPRFLLRAWQVTLCFRICRQNLEIFKCSRFLGPRKFGRKCDALEILLVGGVFSVDACCLGDRRRDLATGSNSVSKIVLRSCGCFCLISRQTIMVWKAPRNPKQIAIIAVLRPYLSTLFLLLGRESRLGTVWRQDLAILSPEGPATAPANYGCLTFF